MRKPARKAEIVLRSRSCPETIFPGGWILPDPFGSEHILPDMQKNGLRAPGSLKTVENKRLLRA